MLSLQQAVKSRSVVRHQGSHIYQINGSQMAIMLALRASQYSLPEYT